MVTIVNNQKINNLFALWDPIGVKRIEPGMQFDEYISYANKVATLKTTEIENYLIEIYTDMVDSPNQIQMQEIQIMSDLISTILLLEQ